MLPTYLLARLERLLEDPAAALPPLVSPHRARLRLARPGPRLATPLFSGELRFVSFEITTAPQTAALRVSDVDLGVAQEYATRASAPISRYAEQYGPNRLGVSPTRVPYSAAAPGGRYSDATLQNWANEIARQGGLDASSCLVFLNPPGAENTDALASQGVLGYHGFAQLPYVFVNVIGSGFALPDAHDQFALALSHEIAEMTVDPQANDSNPECCDPCGPNCQTPFRDYFDGSGRYLGSTTAFGPPYPYGFFINGIVKPGDASACPAPATACAYAPP